jgi:hypothetical protein
MSGTTGTVYPLGTFLTNQFADSAPPLSITQKTLRDFDASIQAVSGVVSVAGKTGAVVLVPADIPGLAAALPLATTAAAGFVKPDGTTITITAAGVISATAASGVTSVAGRTGAVTLTHSDLTDWAAATAAFTGGAGNPSILLASQYGVVADGTTDDTAAWAAAFGAATTGQIVFAPPRVSAISTITIPGGVTLMGCHTPAYCVNNGAAGVIGYGSILKKISGTGPAVIISAVRTNNANGAATEVAGGIRNMAILGDGTHACLQVGNNGSQGPSWISDCTFAYGSVGVDANTLAGLGFGYGWYNLVNCIISACATGVWNGVDSKIMHCYINGGGGDGIHLDSGASDINILGNKIEFNAGHGVYSNQTDDVNIVGNILDASGKSQISANGQTNLVVTGNSFRRGGNTQANNHSIDDCHIYVTGCDGTVICGNTTRALSASDGSGPVVPSYTLAGGPNTNVLLTGNFLRGYTTAYLNPTFTPTGLTSTGNVT